MDDSPSKSRRCLLKGALLLTWVPLTAGLDAGGAWAQQKATKKSMKYQDKPNGDKHCGNCAQFVPPDACKVVQGTVSPQGYCLAWTKK